MVGDEGMAMTTAVDGQPDTGSPGFRAEETDLQRMANQIAANFAHHEEDVAAGEVANHLKLFWTPAMRSLLKEMAADTEWELDPLVRAALELLPG